MERRPDRTKSDALSDDDIIGAVLRSAMGNPATAAPRPKPVQHDWTLWGFDGKARVQTNFGQLPIEALRLRDSVLTASGAYRKITWIETLRLDADFLEVHRGALPILIGADAIGPGRPQRTLLVSPGQPVNAARFGPDSAMTLAVEMKGKPGVLVQATEQVTYYLFSYGEAGSVNVEGVWCHTETSDSVQLNDFEVEDES